MILWVISFKPHNHNPKTVSFALLCQWESRLQEQERYWQVPSANDVAVVVFEPSSDVSNTCAFKDFF